MQLCHPKLAEMLPAGNFFALDNNLGPVTTELEQGNASVLIAQPKI